MLEGDSYRIHRLELGPMRNLVYLVEDRQSRRAAVVDPAWDLRPILRLAEDHGLVVTDVLLTHGHDDHTNGLEGLLSVRPARVHVTAAELEFWRAAVQGETGTGVPADRGTEVWRAPPPGEPLSHADGDRIRVGRTEIDLLHTPGHSPGSACYRLGGHVLTGDTLFVYGCGRCDLPGGDAARMFESLSRLKSSLPDEAMILPGHHYAQAQESLMGEQRRANPFLHFDEREAFMDFRARHNLYRSPPYGPVPEGEPAW